MQQKQQHSTVLFSICAPTDTLWLKQWEAHLHTLTQNGILAVRSEQHFQPGISRLQQFYDYLEQADFIVLLLSADFFIDDECYALMERALKGHAQIIPLLLRPVIWQETPLATFTCLPFNGRPVTQWTDSESAFADCVRAIRRILGRPVSEPLVHQAQQKSTQAQNRSRMLQRLRHTYEGIFTQSLQDVMRMELGLAHKPDAVQNTALRLLRTTTHQEQLLPPGTSILHVYEEAMQELLILGQPGAGKSTLLVELAQQLVIRAEADVSQPLPVIIPLSSWAIKRAPLQHWLAEQIAQIYAIPRELAQRWIDSRQILPLLDGLDEMEETARPACIAAINTYHRDYFQMPLVVCSRQSEYEEASKSLHLVLQSAVIVQALTSEQIQLYLVQMGDVARTVHHEFMHNPALRDVITTPLMLHIVILAYQGVSLSPLLQQQEQLQQQIWTDYIIRMVERKGNQKRYPLYQTRLWLGWLAHQMRTHNQPIFYLEQIQLDWLTNHQRRIYNYFGVRLPSVLIGALVSMLTVFLFLNSSMNISVEIILAVTLGGMLGGLLCPLVVDDTVHDTAKTRRTWKTIFGISIGVGLIVGCSLGWRSGATLNEQWLFGLIVGVPTSIGSFLLQMLLRPISRHSSPLAHSRAKWWEVLILFARRVYLWYAMMATLFITLSVGLGVGLNIALREGLIEGMSIGVSYGLSYGLTCILISVILAYLQGAVYPTEHIAWTWRHLRSRLFASTHVRLTLLIIGCVTAFVGLSNGVSYGLSVGLAYNGLGYGLNNALVLGPSVGLNTGYC
ncbi:MAG TPA: NACHT domain-containing protein [Ktedonobacteraceae bacterium]|nr:NACHT domain-containing protein [Ktedonobacteraceae bacterium]